jgi:hypothetical protein
MTSLRVFVDLTVQILNPSVGFPQLSGSSDNYKTEDWSTIYVSYLDMYKCKRMRR